MLRRLQHKWGLSPARVVLVLLTFALTGTTVVVIKPYLLHALVGDSPLPWWGTVLYYILILPVYQALLLVWGALLGQYSFFIEKEKKLWRLLTGRRKTPTHGGKGKEEK